MKNVASKWARALAVMVVVLLGVSMIPGMVFDSPVTENAKAAGETYVKIGWVSEVINWNPMDIAMVEDWVTCFLVFSTLWRFDENWGEPVEDLVTSWNTTYYGDGTMTLWINITENAYFRNEAQTGIDSTDYPLTADDVVFTLDMAKSRTSTAWEFYLRDYENITAVDDYTVRMDIPYYKAVLIEDLCGIPIVPQFQWQPWVDDKSFMNSMDPDEVIGSAMFVYEDHLTGSWYMYKKAPNYHGEADYGAERTVSVDGILYDLSTSDSDMIFSANAGEIDAVALTGSATLFLEELGVGTDEPIVKSVVQEPGICDIALNAIPMEYRYDGSGANDYGLGSPHLLDKEVRKAILMTLDRDFINNTIMGGLAVEGTSVIPPGSWQADIEGVLPFDTAGAKQVLLDAGYEDDGGAFLIATDEAYVVTEGLIDIDDTDALRLEHIRCHAPSTDTSYVDITMAWAGWAEDAMIGFDAGPINEAQMINDEWYKALFDIWVWHWGWGPEPLGNLCVWLTSEMHVGGDNCEMPMGPWWVNTTNYTTSPYVNASMIEEFDMDSDDFIGFSAFDQNFSLAQRTVDVGERQVLVKKLQQWIYDSYTETPPYYDVGLYGFSTARFQGWGNWELHSGRTVISSLPWLWFDLEPTGVPMFDTGLAASYEAQLDDPTSFSVMIHDSDGDPLDVTWSFGDGSLDVTTPYTTGTAASFEASVTHTYTTLATGLTLTVTVSDGTNTIEDSALVDVVAVADEIPEISNPSHSPPVAYIGDTTTWSITASDAEATELMVTWEWDDGSFTSTLIPIGTPGTPVTDEKTHVFDSPGTYDVTVYVDDGSPLVGHNNSLVVAPAYSVIANTPPLAPDIDDYATNVGVLTSLSATSSDPDPDALRFTWEWDDGTFDVIDYPADPGATIVSDVEHTWGAAGTYPVTVWVDDLTGEVGHNVSTTIDVVVTIPPQQPANIQLVADPSPALEDQPVWMEASATDGNGDALIITVDFGDDESYEETTVGGTTGPQFITVSHTYADADTYTVTVSADDGTTVVSKGFTLVVDANTPPYIQLVGSYSAMYNETFTITPTDVSDADDDDLTVWYDWGDGSPMTEGNPSIGYAASHEYHAAAVFTLKAYVDDNTGVMGHNVSTTAAVSVGANLRPAIVDGAHSADNYTVGSEITFTVIVKDPEGDPMVVKIIFGDTQDVTQEAVTPTGNEEVTVTMTHTYTTSGEFEVSITVEDDKDHVNPQWNDKPMTLIIEPAPSEDDDGGGGSNIYYIAGGALLAIIVIAVVAMMMKKRKGKDLAAQDTGAGGGMEGMQPPEGPPPA